MLRKFCTLTLLLGGMPGGALWAQTKPDAAAHLEITTPLGMKMDSLPDTKGAVAKAEQALTGDPNSVKLLLQLSQAEASVWQNREAVETDTRALKVAPNDADVLTERGHRELPMRDFAKAQADLQRAVELDAKKPDAYYHLGLAHYFQHEFSPAADAFCKGVEFTKGQDELVNFTNWCYASLRRAGRGDEATKALAKVTDDMKSNPGHTEFYFKLVRFYQGKLTESAVLPPPPKDADDVEGELAYDTMTYQIANWHLYNGEGAKAKEMFQKIVKGRVWVTWGYIASERELVAAK